MENLSLTQKLQNKGFTHQKSTIKKLSIGARDILKGGVIVFTGNYKEVNSWLKSI